MPLSKAMRVMMVGLIPVEIVACKAPATDASPEPKYEQTKTQVSEKKAETPMTEAYKKAIALAAVADNLLISEHKPDLAIAKYREGLKADPTCRVCKAGLAFALYRSKRTSEAIPIWKELARGKDTDAITAANFLKKTAGAAETKK